jgi:hypothetical protein
LEQPVNPDRLSLTHWYANQPEAAVTIAYSQQAHQANWRELELLVNEIDTQLQTETILPLTTNLLECTRCAYAIYCGRPTGLQELDEWQEEEMVADLAPPIP